MSSQLNIMVINDMNDINNTTITHFSLDKGHFLAQSFVNLGHNVFFVTTVDNYEKNGIKYVKDTNITDNILDTIDYIIISREALLPLIINKIAAIKKRINIPKNLRSKPKFIIKSDNPMWFYEKEMRKNIGHEFTINASTGSIRRWVMTCIDFICAQNDDFKNLALVSKVPNKMLLVSNMGIPNMVHDYTQLSNPYDKNYSYCVNNAASMQRGKALFPLYYVENPQKIAELQKKRKIIVYTGRIKVDKGNILFNMKNIMEILGDEYELHIFPGSFFLPVDGQVLSKSARDANALVMMRNIIYGANKNIIIHYPYEHKEKYRYLHFADCGIDFSDVRPRNINSMAGHAKILEYCEIGLPIVCEENINNINLVKNGKNGLILPYLATDEQYATAIKLICNSKIDRQYCRKTTIENENWDKKAVELLAQIKMV